MYNTHEIHEVVRRAILYMSDDVVIKTVSGKMCSCIPMRGVNLLSTRMKFCGKWHEHQGGAHYAKFEA